MHFGEGTRKRSWAGCRGWVEERKSDFYLNVVRGQGMGPLFAAALGRLPGEDGKGRESGAVTPVLSPSAERCLPPVCACPVAARSPSKGLQCKSGLAQEGPLGVTEDRPRKARG